MKNQWNDENISKILKAGRDNSQPAFDPTWFKIEERLEARKNHFWNNLVWKPWGHPVRWVVAAACLCVASTGAIYHQNSVDQSETDAFLFSVANPTANVTKNLGVAKVSVLLSETSRPATDIKVDDHFEPIAADEILL
jgi:hypothetical protein